MLYKLDGGLDHLLLDEVQDTAPAQWDIADRLTADFFTGQGAREQAGLARTIFAVGDRKQSIYSFQGADPAGFDLWRKAMRRQVAAAGGVFRDTELGSRSARPRAFSPRWTSCSRSKRIATGSSRTAATGCRTRV